MTIEASAFVTDPNATDTDGDGTVEDEERYTVNAVLTRPGQGGNDDDEWNIREGSPPHAHGQRHRGLGSTGTPSSPTIGASSPLCLTGPSSTSPPARSTTSRHRRSPRRLQKPSAVVIYSLIVTDSVGLQTTTTVRINVVEYQIPPTVTIELASPSEPAQDANALTPTTPLPATSSSPAVRSTSLPPALMKMATRLGSSACLVGPRRHRQLVQSPHGRGVPGCLYFPGHRHPRPVVHRHRQCHRPHQPHWPRPDSLHSGRQRASCRHRPSDLATSDGSLGGTDRNGTVDVVGRGTDTDGDRLTYRWVETDANGTPLEEPTVVLVNADSATVSFAAPQLSANSLKRIYLTLTVIDVWGVSDTDTVTITILGVNEKPTADAGPDQVVDPGQRSS